MKSMKASWVMPEIGDVVEDFGDRLIVVGTFCTETEWPLPRKHPHFFGVSEEGLDEYFSKIGRKLSATDFVERQFGLFDRRYESAPSATNRVFSLVDPRDSSSKPLYEKRDLGVSSEHQIALAEGGSCSLKTLIKVDGILHVIDGSYLTMKKEKPTVMVTLMNYTASRHSDLYRVFDIDRMLRSIEIGNGRRYGRKLGPKLELVHGS